MYDQGSGLEPMQLAIQKDSGGTQSPSDPDVNSVPEGESGLPDRLGSRSLVLRATDVGPNVLSALF